MTQLFINSRLVKIATIPCWLFVPEHTRVVALAKANPLPVGCHRRGRQGLASRFWMRLACLCEGMTAN